jgi:hypothetical protein
MGVSLYPKPYRPAEDADTAASGRARSNRWLRRRNELSRAASGKLHDLRQQNDAVPVQPIRGVHLTNAAEMP